MLPLLHLVFSNTHCIHACVVCVCDGGEGWRESQFVRGKRTGLRSSPTMSRVLQFTGGLNLSYETFTLSLILKGQCPVLDTLYLFWSKKWFLVSFVFRPYKADKVQQNPVSQKCQESLIDKHFGCRSTVSARQNNQIKGGCRCPGTCRRGVYSSFTTTSLSAVLLKTYFTLLQEGADGEGVCKARDKRVREVVQECNAGMLGKTLK